MKNAVLYSIPEHWDTAGVITAESDPQTEYDLWAEHARNNPRDWNGAEFSLDDFRRYIDSLKKDA